ncbi:MAG: FAD-dependent thymidylate synthase [Candidatus Omnitrophica bacterium]|nr:FAD-dependent thymidylate synthase [Candidatus Omnitrophota bacterium]
MPQEAHLNVRLLEVTQNALAVIYAACRQCYSAEFAGNIFDRVLEEPDKMESFIRKVIASGHESPLEHAKFTFAVEGVSRALTHQLVRHRIASFSQQSQRYVRESDFDYIVPPSLGAHADAKQEFRRLMEDIQQSYARLLQFLKEHNKEGESANQDARFILPQAAETKIVVTMNCRELIHFFKLRCCSRAQWEIRSLAYSMLKICQVKLPAVFAGLGAKCDLLKYCPEGEKFSCGRYPVK